MREEESCSIAGYQSDLIRITGSKLFVSVPCQGGSGVQYQSVSSSLLYSPSACEVLCVQILFCCILPGLCFS